MKKRGLPLATIVALAMLSAISIIAGKYLAISGGDILRFSFENLPIIFAAVGFGPIEGVLVGVVADLIGCLLVGYAINPIVTLGAAAIGAVSGVAAMLLRKAKLPLSATVVVSVASAHIIGSVVIKTIGLAAFYSIPIHLLMLWRLLNYLLIGALEGIILYALLRNKQITGQLSKMKIGITEKEASADKIEMTYEEALDYIHGVNKAFCKPGLERIRALCKALGDPQKNMTFIHVAGTNGKGSTSSMLSNILIRAGYRVGLYTSPFIYRFNERIRVDGKDISDDDLARLTHELKPIVDAMEDKPTEFELITAIAFEHFKRSGCRLVVLEVGMGGRFDSTNVIRRPLLSIITGISLDHTAYLGETTEQIAFEKAGIIKDGAPVIFGGEDPGALGVISGIAAERGSKLYRPDYGAIRNAEMSLEGGRFDYKEYKNVKLSLLGEYQFRNAAVVLEAVDILRDSGVKIGADALYEGIYATKWRARFEIIHRAPTVIFDGAHNPEGIKAATESIKKYFPSGKVAVMSGVLADKDYETIADSISEVAEAAFTITPDNPRALSAEAYAEVLSKRGVCAIAKDSIGEALSDGMKYAEEKEVPLFCLGSLYTYSSVIDALNNY